MSSQLAAQAQAPEATTIETVLVTITRLPKAVTDVTTSISVVDEAALAEQFAVSPDVLEALTATVPGLNVSSGTRQACGTNIRGRAASFQINGIPVNQDLRGSNCNAMFQVSPFALERVEVLRGASALYGAGAPGGIVNLVTRRAKSAQLEVDLLARTSANLDDASDTLDYDIYAGAGQSFEGWDYYAGLAYQDAGAARTPNDTFVPREEFQSWSFNTSVGVALAEGKRVRFTGTFYNEEPGDVYAADGSQSVGSFAPVFRLDRNPYAGQSHDRLATLIASYEQDEFLGHALHLSAYLQQQEYLQRTNFYFAGFGNDFFNSNQENDRYGFRSTLARSFDFGATDLELEYGVDYVSNRYYRPIVDPANGGRITGFVSPETTLRIASGFLQADFVFGRLRVSTGARHERYTGRIGDEGYDPAIFNATVPGRIGKNDLWLLNAGAVFDLSERVQIYGGFNQGAELSELARAARGLQDPALISPEAATSDQYELGVRGSAGPVDFSAAVFYSEADKAALLQADPSCAGQSFCPLIPLRTPQRFHGIESTLDWKVSRTVTTGAVFTYQRGKILNEELGRYIDYSLDTISPLRLTAYLTLEPIAGWRSRVQGTYFGAADYYSPGETSLGFVNTDSLFLMDLTSSLRIGSGELTLSIANLLDKAYVNVRNQASGDFFYYMEEGRRVSLSYRVRL